MGEPIVYAGIGSRETPPDILDVMSILGQRLALNGYKLHSGGARGADKAFEYGCDLANGPKQIYYKEEATPQAMAIAERFHPAWHNCSLVARKLHARNAKIVLGSDLKSPVEMVIAWTFRAQLTGGTAMALRIAYHHNIPVWNLAFPVHYRRVYGLYIEGKAYQKQSGVD